MWHDKFSATISVVWSMWRNAKVVW